MVTRHEAERRSELIDVRSYRVELDLTGDAGFTSRTTVRFRCRTPGASCRIDLDIAEVRHAVLNGGRLEAGEGGIELPDLAAENELVVDAAGRWSASGRGLSRFVDPADDAVYVHTQCQPEGAARIFACFDQPDLKAPVELRVVAPPGWTVAGNAPAAGPAVAGLHLFEPSAPLPPYLVAVVAGPLAAAGAVWRDGDHDVPLRVLSRASTAGQVDAAELLATTARGLAHFRDVFATPYPFAKLDLCLVAELPAAAMENAACVTMAESVARAGAADPAARQRRAGVLLHELAHMWFGDLVTMRWWDDLWLNESFAAWAAVHAQAALGDPGAWTAFALTEKAWAYEQDRLPSTHPIVADVADRAGAELRFDGITYAKGAAVLRQLVAWTGEDRFRAGLADYLRRHAYGNAGLADLLGALARASGRDLASWADEWLRTTGVSELRPVLTRRADGRLGSVAVEQGGSPRRHRVAVGVYDDDGSGALVRVARVEVDVAGPRTAVPALTGRPAGKLILVNDDDLGYAAARLDPGSVAVLRTRIGDVTPALPRALCWSAAWEMTRDAGLRARDYLGMTLGALDAETEPAMRHRLLQRANSAICLYVDPDHAPAAWRRLTGRLTELAVAAAPGGERQAAYVRALTAAVLDEDVLRTLRACLDGAGPFPGLVVDDELRRRLVHALVAHGTELPEAELRRDPAARAACPTAAAKRSAWREILGDGLGPAARDQVMAGFAHPAQVDLIAGYAREYVAALDRVAGRWPAPQTHHFALRLFPLWAVSGDTEAALREWLERQAPGPLRTVVADGHDGLCRALAARAADRAGVPAAAPRG
ncbi:aminopeptidase N [Actinoplanes sp. RD1]|uniref:aminopeptidase N n=1 Tax=Actinoplanes sp. RD1 TaxID=3064538 RepID=UPI0027406A2C|nr:aminopeptidase N [Actinoplanes sp. RD1]